MICVGGLVRTRLWSWFAAPANIGKFLLGNLRVHSAGYLSV